MPTPVAAPPYRGTLFINDTDDNEGWSESYWVKGSSYTAARDNLNLVLQARLSTLTPEMQIAGGRVSDMSIRGDTLLASVPFGQDAFGRFQPSGGNPSVSMPSRVCLYIRLEANTPKPRHVVQPFHGIPRSAMLADHDMRINRGGDYRKAVDKFWRTVSPLLNVVVRDAGSPVISDVREFRVPIDARYRAVGRPFALFRGHRAPI